MTGQELWEVRDWIMEQVNKSDLLYSETRGIVDMLNEFIKENILTVRVPEDERTYTSGCTTFQGLIMHGNKIPCIKIIRKIFGWGLKESKDWLDEKWGAIWAPIAG